MYGTPSEARALVEALLSRLLPITRADIVLCPPFIDLTTAAGLLQGTHVSLGAQNAYDQDRGAFTGEVSAAMLVGLARYVILGHSERRAYFGETDGDVNRKLHAARRHGLNPIVCVGEQLADYVAGRTTEVVRRQVKQSLAGLTGDTGSVVVAYEPVWAIGTGRAATPEIAQETAALIRGELAAMYGTEATAAIRIQYGGSVTAANCAGFFRQPDIDGALVGGASLEPGDFAAIAEAAAASHPARTDA